MSWYYHKPYMSAAEKRANATGEIARRRKKGLTVSPIHVDGLKLGKTFWGKAWCDHIESLASISNRLPRGKTYVRNGSVIDLQIEAGKVNAIVMGSEMYEVTIDITKLPPGHWGDIKSKCGGQIASIVELLQGKLSKAVMEVATAREGGMFPVRSHIQMECTCPDGMPGHVCKHVAAVLYGIGVRLDDKPELLFQLRGVDHNDLITAVAAEPVKTGKPSSRRTIAPSSLSAVFGIEMGETPAVSRPVKAKTAKKKAKTPRSGNQ